jgi:acyl-CoA thioester hydrolase
MPVTFRTVRRVEFGDTDMGGIVHFPNYFKYMEAAEHLFLESIGHPSHREGADGSVVAWPRVSASCDYSSPLRFADNVEITLSVRRRGEKSVTYDFAFDIGDRKIARGTVTAACIDASAGAPLKAIPIPAALARKLDGLA